MSYTNFSRRLITMTELHAENEIKEVKSVEAKDKNEESIYDFDPLVYSFKVPADTRSSSIAAAALPDHRLYQDHAFGVIWMLFSKQKQRYIGISQLHWCLRFLTELKNSDGTYTGDVNVCIQAVEDALIEQYAKLGDVMMTKMQQEKRLDTSVVNSSDKIPHETKLEEAIARRREKDKETEEENEGKALKQDEETSEWQTKDKNDEIDKKPDEIASKNKKCNKGCGKTERIGPPMSLTYNEMISRGEVPCREQPKLNCDSFLATSSTADVFQQLVVNAHISKESIAEMDKEQLIHFLKSSRQQHVDTIKREIERLYVLEKFMKNLDKDCYKACIITDDLAKRLDKLENSEIIDSVKEMIK